MAFRSGECRGSYSTVIQGRSASVARLALLVWTGPLSSTSTTGTRVLPDLGAAPPVQPA